MKGYGRTMRTGRYGIRPFIMAMMLLLITWTVTAWEADAATSYAYTAKEVQGNGGTKFTVPALKLTGVCCQYGKKLKSGKAKLSRLSNNSTTAKVAYYWGVVKGYDKKALGSTERKKLTMMMQYITSSSSVKSFSYVKNGNCKKDINKAKSVKVPETFVIYKANPTNKSQDFVAWRNASGSSLTLIKTSKDPGLSSRGGYDFSGISYQVYRSDKKTAVGVLTCNSKGTTNKLTGLAAGTYYAKEKTTNRYYSLNSSWVGVTVGEGATGTFRVADAPLKGRVRLTKGSTDSNSINAGYDFKGIEYGVYAAQSQSSELLAKLTLDEAGVSNTSVDLPVGTKYIREIKTNSYYKLSETWYPVNITGGSVAELTPKEVMDEPVTGTLSIRKRVIGSESTEDTFMFELINRENSSITYSNIEVRGDGTAKTIDVLAGRYILRETDSGDYVDETGDQEIVIKEGETSEVERVNRAGKPGTLQVRKTTDDGGSKEGFRFIVTGSLKNQGLLTADQVISAADPLLTFEDEIYEAGAWTVDEDDLRSVNIAADNRDRGEYRISLKSTAVAGEQDESGTDEKEPIDITLEVIVTLAPVKWDEKTRMYAAETEKGSGVFLDGKGYKATVNDFIWHGSATAYTDRNTGRDHTVLVTDRRGCGINESTGTEGIEDLAPGEYKVREDMDQNQQSRYLHPQEKTAVWNGTEGGVFRFDFRNVSRTTDVRLVKTSMDGRISGIEFRLSGKTDFGDNIRKVLTTDGEGKIDFGGVAPGTYVIEEIGWDKTRYANSYPLEGCSAPAKEVKVTGDEKEAIVVAFENVPYAQMAITKLDKETGKFLPGAVFSLVNLSKNESEATFSLIEEDGFPEVRMISSLSQIKVTGQSRSADEEKNGMIMLTGLTSGDEYKIMEIDPPLGYGITEPSKEFKADFSRPFEAEFIDEESRIETVAADAKTGGNVSMAEDGVALTDSVAYENLVPGKEYRLEGVLMDKSDYLVSNRVEDMKEAKDDSGKTIKSEVRFTPETSDGRVEVPFRFDGSELAGSNLVVYEKLYTEKGLVTSHEDPESREQSIDMPGIRTTATAEDTKMHITNSSDRVMITDVVSYTKLTPGSKYHLRGVLIDKKTEKPIMPGGREVVAEMDFVPERDTGSVSLVFEFDGSELAGTDVVAYEELSLESSLVAQHKDPSDPAQTVRIPKIGTTADRISKGKIEDRVRYSGLISGEEYIMSGFLVDKDTGTRIDGTDSRMRFKAEKGSGTVVIPFSISADKLTSKGIDQVVVFEKCEIMADLKGDGKSEPVEVASHRDINDKNQMVDLREPYKKTRTGDGARLAWLLLFIPLIGSGMGIAVLLCRRRRCQ